MARRAGRNAGIYVATTTGGSATPLTFQNKWSMNFESEKIDVTAFQDTNKTYVAGIADAMGDFSLDHHVLALRYAAAESRRRRVPAGVVDALAAQPAASITSAVSE